MNLVMFAIYDSKAEAFLQPFFSPTTAMGVRSFAEASNDPQTNFYKHPSDYTLFKIGDYNSTTGMVTALGTLENLGLSTIHQKPETAIASLDCTQEN